MNIEDDKIRPDSSPVQSSSASNHFNQVADSLNDTTTAEK